jgi:phage baseplate assembly protein W
MAAIKRFQTFTQTGSTADVYSDLTTSFAIHPNKLDLLVSTNEEAVKRSILNILFTNRGERLFNPTFGSNMQALLFENISPQTESAIKSYIETSIENEEPRAQLIDVVVAALPDENAYAATVVFSIINNSDPIILDFLLNRIR